ncbi:MAG: ParA family protein [Firmicutes bacterium]|nr:ParA family protein [Bacillota bacterium]
MGRVIAIVNQKGGVGKTTTAVSLGGYLARSGKKVLLADIDPQGNATTGAGVDKRQLKRSVYGVLVGGAPAEEAIVESAVEGLWVLPATIDLAGAEIELVSSLSREFRLRESLARVREWYDYVLIDSPPSLGLLTINGLAAADGALVPIQCEYYALEGLSQLMRTIAMVQEHLNSSLVVDGVAMTMYDPRTNLSQQVVEDVRAFFDGKVRVYRALIPRNVRLTEAPSFGKPIVLYDDRSRGAQAYRELALEVMEVGEAGAGQGFAGSNS